jgi:transcriptional regulator with XRE-family HTH domain
MNKRAEREGLPDDAKMRRVALGKLLREARQQREKVLSEVAKSAGVSVPYLSDLERGKRAISPKRLDKLAKVLELDSDSYVKLFQLRGRLPPYDEAWLVQHPEHWPSRRKQKKTLPR